jgi:ATP-dependent DNA helicase RecQ
MVAEAPTASPMQRAARVLNDTFGHADFRSGQRQVIELLLAPPEGLPARALAVFPTGAGKSLTYQLPALIYDSGVTLVVSPLLALMRDQTLALVRKGVPAASLDSSLDAAETRDLYEQVREGKIKLLFVAPERFKNERFVRLLNHVSVALFVVDEAHCISEWGHSFRPDYLRLARFADELGFERRLCLTATATPKVAEDIAASMSIPFPDCVVRTPAVRPNLDTRITLINSEFEGERKSLADSVARRIDVLATRINSRPPGATIVYVTLQATAVAVAEELRKRGLVNAKAYHAGITQDERKATQDWFMDAQDGQSAVS